MPKDSSLTNKEILDLRLKCLEVYVNIASKHNIEDDIVFKKAEKAWEFINKTSVDKEVKIP